MFLDGIFRKVDEFIEGNHSKRYKLDKAPWDFRKVRIKSFKYMVYLILSMIITHSFLAYFVGVEELKDMVRSPPSENWFSFMFIVLTTSSLMFNFLWFREQFCIIMCPYGRFQSVLMDENSLAPLYDAKRGEPRRQGKGEEGKAEGDCIDCFKCVAVCPTGIDIRNGIQMECVACTACIDACDGIMEKVKKPKGLIRYNSEAGENKRKMFGARSLVYAISIVAAIVGLTFFLNKRTPYAISMLRQKGIPFRHAQGEVLGYSNFFKLYAKNQVSKEMKVTVALSEQYRSDNIKVIIPQNPLVIKPEGVHRLPVFVKFSKDYKFLKNRDLTLDFKIEIEGKVYLKTKSFHLAFD